MVRNLAAICVALVLAACGPSEAELRDRLAGTWRFAHIRSETEGEEPEDVDLQDFGAIWRWKKDGSVRNLTHRVGGSWTLEGERLHVRWDDGGERDFRIERIEGDELVLYREYEDREGRRCRSTERLVRVEDPGPEEPPRARREDTGLGFSVEVPPGWENAGDLRPGDVVRSVHFRSPAAEDGTEFLENIGLYRLTPFDGKSVRELVDLSLEDIRAQPGYRIGERRELEVDGRPAIRNRVIRESDMRNYFQYCLTGSDGEAVRITATVPEAGRERYEPVFDAIVTSIRFE